MKTEIENIIYNWTDEIPHILIRVINAITLSDSKEEARQKVLQHCGLVMGGSIHSTLPDDEINWAFDIHPNRRIDKITKV